MLPLLIQTNIAPDKLSVLIPLSSSSNLAENSVKLVDYMFEYTTKAADFKFWFDLVKEHYLFIFYSDLAKKVGVTKEFGFKYCPYPIQACIINYLEQWYQNDAIIQVILNNEDNIALNQEILNQCCRLPMSERDTIRRGVHIFKSLLFNSNIHPVIAPHLVEYRKNFFQKMALIFTVERPGQSAEQIDFCKEMLLLLEQIFKDFFFSFPEATQ